MPKPDADHKFRPADGAADQEDVEIYRALRVVRLKDKLQSLYEEHFGGEQPFPKYYADLRDDLDETVRRIPNDRGHLDVKAWISGLRNAYNLIWHSEMAEISGRHLEADDLLGDAKYWMGVVAGLVDQADLSAQRSNKLLIENPTSSVMRENGSKGGNEKNRTYKLAKAYCLERWEAERLSYADNKSSFARDYERIIPQKFSAKNGDPLPLTFRTVQEWLK